MASSPPKGKQPQKSVKDRDKVPKILAEARKVVDALLEGGEAAPPSPKEKRAALQPEIPPSLPAADTAKKPAPRSKTPAAPRVAPPRKVSPTSTAKAQKKAKPADQPPTAPPAAPLLSPRECGILVTHALPGRVRLRVKTLRFNSELAQELETRLAAIHGVKGVEASPATGSLLINYGAKEIVEVPLGKALKYWFPRLDAAKLLAELPA